MGFEEEVDLYHKMTPPPNLGHSWVVFEEWSQILSSTKLLRLGFEQSCSAMATQKLEEKVKQHDEVVESSKTDCRSQSRAHGKAFRCVGISINFGSRHKTVLFSVFWVLCILLCGVSNVFVCYKHGDGRDFPQPRFGRGSVMNNSRGKSKILEGSVMKIPSRHIPHTSGPIQWARSDVGLKPSAAARPRASACTDLRHLCPTHLVRSYHLGGYFAHREQNNPPKYLGNKSEIPYLNFTPPPIISAFVSKCENSPSKPIVSL